VVEVETPSRERRENLLGADVKRKKSKLS